MLTSVMNVMARMSNAKREGQLLLYISSHAILSQLTIAASRTRSGRIIILSFISVNYLDVCQ